MNDPDYYQPPEHLPASDYNLTLILVLGICGVTFCGCCAPFALGLGIKALQDMDDDEIYTGSERVLAQVGCILGFIGMILWAAALLIFMLRFNQQAHAYR